jgi:hypothetical protein
MTSGSDPSRKRIDGGAIGTVDLPPNATEGDVALAVSRQRGRAVELAGEELPDHLVQAGRLRVEHDQASLEELGQLAEPPMTKDAVAGRIRRLLARADKKAKDMRIPDTSSVVTEEMSEMADR